MEEDNEMLKYLGWGRNWILRMLCINYLLYYLELYMYMYYIRLEC